MYLNSTVERILSNKDMVIQTVREDRQSKMNEILYLKSKITDLELTVERERERADNAVDQLMKKCDASGIQPPSKQEKKQMEKQMSEADEIQSAIKQLAIVGEDME